MKTADAYVPMKTDFQGFCAKCRCELPEGVDRRYHRFSRQIRCMKCVSSEKPTKTATREPAVDVTLQILIRLAARLEVDISDLVGDAAFAPLAKPPETVKLNRPGAEELIKMATQLVEPGSAYRQTIPAADILIDAKTHDVIVLTDNSGVAWYIKEAIRRNKCDYRRILWQGPNQEVVDL